MSFFSDAQNFTINNASFTNNVLEGKDKDYSGLKILHRKAVLGAFYNSEQRFPPPNCHPGTRAQALHILKNWVTDVNITTSVFWLYGSAGVGKSAVAQTISETFAASHLAASFFFSRTDPSRNNLSSFLFTISYQLATSSTLGPLLREHINAIVQHNPGIIDAVLEQQFEELIVLPCRWLTATCSLTFQQWKNIPHLIVIDGLDECNDFASQERLLSMICKAKSTNPPLPLDFLICSRPEPCIRNCFSHQDFHSILDCNDIGASYQSGKDIGMYLRHEFGRIRHKHGQSMAYVAKDWPGNGIIQQLVQKACGQFIYAATVIKYVGDYNSYPPEQLEIILKITVPDDFDSPYPDLDLLYLQILSLYPVRELPLLLEIMAHILRPANIFFDEHFAQTSSRIIEGLFCLAKGKLWAILSRLHSVLYIPENDDINITVLHASFTDFLTDRKRSGKYFLERGKEAQHERVLFCLLKIILNSIKKNCDDHSHRARSALDAYAYSFWAAHFRNHLGNGESSSTRVLSSLIKIDVHALLNITVQCKNSSLEIYVDALRKCLRSFRYVVQWASDLQHNSNHSSVLDSLIKQYSLFEHGVTFHLQARPNLPVLISLLKTIVLYNLPGYHEVMENRLRLSMIFQKLEVPIITEVHNILDSSWPTCPFILPLSMNPSNSATSRTTVVIDFAECHQQIGLHCLQVLSEGSSGDYLKILVDYAKSQWFNHILKTVPSNEMLQVLLDNLSLLPKDAHKKVLAWATEAAEKHDGVNQWLVEQIQKALLSNSHKTPTLMTQSHDKTHNQITSRKRRKNSHKYNWNRLSCFS